MTLHWKLVIDAADPHAQADFWAQTLGYEVEDNTPIIETLLAGEVIDASQLTEHHGRQAFRDAVAVRHPKDPVDPDSGTGLGRRLLFQRVPEAKPDVKNRLHVDVHTAPGHRQTTVDKLTELGAKLVRDVRAPEGEWTVMTDPEGNEFCVH